MKKFPDGVQMEVEQVVIEVGSDYVFDKSEYDTTK